MSNNSKAFVYTHLGLGDMFTMNGAVRFLKERYDGVYVVCKGMYKETVRSMYEDDPDIRIVVVEGDEELHPWNVKSQFFLEKGFDVYGCGFFSMKPHREIYDFPNSFYDDMNIPRSVRRSHFKVPRTEAALTLCRQFSKQPYIIVHQEASTATVPIVKRLRAAGETRLIIDLTKNQSESEKDMATPLYRPFIEYASLLEGADEIHMVDSSLFCFTMFLNLENVKRRVYYIRPGGCPTDNFNLFEAVTDYM